jgi:hypothetical protein
MRGGGEQRVEKRKRASIPVSASAGLVRAFSRLIDGSADTEDQLSESRQEREGTRCSEACEKSSRKG